VDYFIRVEIAQATRYLPIPFENSVFIYFLLVFLVVADELLEVAHVAIFDHIAEQVLLVEAVSVVDNIRMLVTLEKQRFCPNSFTLSLGQIRIEHYLQTFSLLK